MEARQLDDPKLFAAATSTTAYPHSSSGATNVSFEMSESASTVSSESSMEAVVSLFKSWREEPTPGNTIVVSNDTTSMSLSSMSQEKLQKLQGVPKPADIIFPSPLGSNRAALTRSSLLELNSEELMQRLKKRCRPEDIPSVPEFKRARKGRLTCTFLNYMGKTRVNEHQQRHGATNSVAIAQQQINLHVVGTPEVRPLEQRAIDIEGTTSCELDLLDEFDLDNDDWFRSTSAGSHISSKVKFGQNYDGDDDFMETTKAFATTDDVATILELELADTPPVVLQETELQLIQ